MMLKDVIRPENDHKRSGTKYRRLGKSAISDIKSVLSSFRPVLTCITVGDYMYIWIYSDNMRDLHMFAIGADR